MTPAAQTSLWVHWILRLSVWACYVGHGIFGIRQKPDWLVFFQPLGPSDQVAFAVMQLIGLVDITMGYLALLKPSRLVLIYTACWGLFTALLRPLIGLSPFEALERAGNYGPSIALLLGAGGAGLLTHIGIYDVSVEHNYRRLKVVLVLTTCLLLIGHGGLALNAKPMLVQHWQSIGVIGIGDSAQSFLRAVGAMEICAALLLVARPTRSLALLIFGWKLATEMLFLTSGDPVWEVLERGGSYGAPLALFALLHYRVPRVAEPGPAEGTYPFVPAPLTRSVMADPATAESASFRAHKKQA